MPKSYKCEVEVRGYELDSYGHVNHAVYVSYLEHARWLMLAQENIGLEQFKEWACWPVIAGLEINYLKPTFLGDRLKIMTQHLEHTKTSISFDHTIYRDEAIILKAKVRAVIVNESGRPTAVPAPLAFLWEI